MDFIRRNKYDCKLRRVPNESLVTSVIHQYEATLLGELNIEHGLLQVFINQKYSNHHCERRDHTDCQYGAVGTPRDRSQLHKATLRGGCNRYPRPCIVFMIGYWKVS